MKRKQPSGFQNRKKKKAVEEESKGLSGSLMKFLTSSKTPDVLIDSDQPSQTSELEVLVEDPVSLQPQPETYNIQPTQTHHDSGNEDGSPKDSSAYYPDIGEWPYPLIDSVRIDLLIKGSEFFQNKEGPFESKKRPGDMTKGTVRQLTSEWFYKKFANDETVLRRWLCYSKTRASLFCFCCKLFAKNNLSSFVSGFNKWWKLNPKIAEHENSPEHLDSLEKSTALSARLKLNLTIDHSRQRIIEKEKRKWRDILHRFLDVTLLLARQNLPFRGHRENEKSSNQGNFLEMIRFLSNYDPVLKQHFTELKQSALPSNRKRTMTSYLSPGVQNEFISILGDAVKKNIVLDIHKAKYFGIMLDSTPDVAHVDQMCLVVRYVHIESGRVEVRESFLEFFPLDKKGACDVTNDILKALEDNELDLQMCRSQGYDNAPTMSGIHSGVQARIKQRNNKVLFVPCANHSLNLCGVHSFGSVASSVTFFGILENIYTFFSSSTHRWDVLMEHVKISVKRVIDTRWSAHFDAVKPVILQFQDLVKAVDALCDTSENIDTRGAAQLLVSNICDFSFLCNLYFWYKVLEEVNLAQKYLQTSGLTLPNCAFKFRYLIDHLKENRENFADDAISYGTKICIEMGISMEKRGRRKIKKTMPGEKAADVGLTLPQELRRSMFECIDRLILEMDKRLSSIEIVSSKFAIVETRNLINASSDVLRDLAANVSETFDEISSENLEKEVIRLRRLLKAAEVHEEKYLIWSALDFLQFIVDFNLTDSLPNLNLALKFFLTICVSVSSCERSFSKLKLIKTHLRSTMNQSRLSSLAILSIENEKSRQISFEEVIDNFAASKVRKQKF